MQLFSTLFTTIKLTNRENFECGTSCEQPPKGDPKRV